MSRTRIHKSRSPSSPFRLHIFSHRCSRWYVLVLIYQTSWTRLSRSIFVFGFSGENHVTGYWRTERISCLFHSMHFQASFPCIWAFDAKGLWWAPRQFKRWHNEQDALDEGANIWRRSLVLKVDWATFWLDGGTQRTESEWHRHRQLRSNNCGLSPTSYS